MAKTINTESFIEAWEGKRCLWDVNSGLSYLYSDLSLNPCASVSNKPRLILLPSQGLTHMDLFLYSFNKQWGNYSSGSFFITFHFKIELDLKKKEF